MDGGPSSSFAYAHPHLALAALAAQQAAAHAAAAAATSVAGGVMNGGYLSSASPAGSTNGTDGKGDPINGSEDGTTSPTVPNINQILTVRLLMQGKEVGSIIGKRGDQIKLIREGSGAKINISDGSCPERIVTMTGTTNTINRAFEMICKKFSDDMAALPNSVPKPPITLRLIVPATQCGSIIGKGGTKIKEIREATGASIQVASEMLPQSTERAVTLSGTGDAIVLCMKEVCQILIQAPPKGATLSYRPKPTFNPLLVATGAAVTAQQLALQQQQAALMAAMMQQGQTAAAAPVVSAAETRTAMAAAVSGAQQLELARAQALAMAGYGNPQQQLQAALQQQQQAAYFGGLTQGVTVDEATAFEFMQAQAMAYQQQQQQLQAAAAAAVNPYAALTQQKAAQSMLYAGSPMMKGGQVSSASSGGKAPTATTSATTAAAAVRYAPY